MPSRRRTMTKCSWRLAALYGPLPSTPEELVKRTMQVAYTFVLSPDEHLQCAKRALRDGADALAHELFEMETKQFNPARTALTPKKGTHHHG